MSDGILAASPMSQGSTSNITANKRQRTQSSSSSSPKKHARDNTNEKQKILLEIEQMEREIEKLQQYKVEHERRKRDEDGDLNEIKEEDEEDIADIEGLEAMLREMDDAALANLLTHDISPTSMEVILPFLLETKKLIPGPAKSAGIEGTGSGHEVDKEIKRIESSVEGPSEVDTEAALQGRINRGKELLQHLAQFAMIDFYKISSTAPGSQRDEPSKIFRTITMTGRTLGLGDLQISIDIQEETSEGESRDGPQIVNLIVEIEGEELYRALGDDHLRNITKDKNLPAIFLSLRTMIPLAKTRLRLFRSIYAAFPDLCRDYLATKDGLREALSQDKSTRTPMSMLMDPAIMEVLYLQNDKGGKLKIQFKIAFSRWGHASPIVTIQPIIPSSSRLSKEARFTLKELPADFNHMCKHVTHPFDVSTAIVTIIHAFFNLP